MSNGGTKSPTWIRYYRKNKVIDYALYTPVDEIGDDAVAAGKGFGDSIVSGIDSGKDKVTGAIDSVMGAIRGFLPGSDAKVGPLSDLTASGRAMVETFNRGVMQAGGLMPFADILFPNIPTPDIPDGRMNAQVNPQTPGLPDGRMNAQVTPQIPDLQVGVFDVFLRGVDKFTETVKGLSDTIAGGIQQVVPQMNMPVMEMALGGYPEP